jgi:prepilin-type N-terminal cleavage/methylation domain-containing protein
MAYISIKNNHKGMSLVEVIIASAIASLVAIFVGVTVAQFASVRAGILNDTKKLYLAEEGYEIIRLIRDEDWSVLSVIPQQTYYHLQVSTTTLGIGLTPEIIDGEYIRSFRLLPLYRNNQGNIVSSTTSGATSDNNGRELYIYVADDSGTTTLRSLLMNFSAI